MSLRWRRIFATGVILCMLAGFSSAARAQPALPPLSDSAEVSLLTMLPGDPTASFVGHSAFRIRDLRLGLDRTYNYGTYNFSDPYFIPKFVYGQLTYLLSTSSYRRLVRRYRMLRRPIIEQKLALRPAQRTQLFRFLEVNARPENRAYRYDFLFDNCATRLRDVLRDVLDAPVRFDPTVLPKRTFRHHLDRYVAGRPWLDFGFDLALGLPTDRVATPREAMFLPEYLMEGFAHATVGRGADRRPLVTRTDTVFWIEGRQFADAPAVPWPQLLGWTLFALLLGLTAWRYRRGRPPLHRLDALLFALIGGAGLVVWFLAFLSEHEVTRHNLNVLWIWPTHLVAAGALLRGTRGRVLRGYLLLSAGAALILALGWPLWPQDLHAAALPLVLLMALRNVRQGLFSPSSRQRSTAS